MTLRVATPLSEIRTTFDLLFQPGDVFEVRALHVGRVKTVSGYFDNRDLAAEAVAALEQRKPSGVYCTINPVLPALLARANNRLVEWPKQTTTDSEILTRRWLPIDIDPVRPSGIAATAEEMTTASDLAKEIEDVLRSRGWPFPIIVDSGNGCYLLYRINLPNTPDSTKLLKQFYAGLETLLEPPDKSEPYSKIDRSVYNAARILRLGGTRNRKGDGTRDRPHRQCTWHLPISDCPVDPIPSDLIRQVAELAPAREPSRPTSRFNNGRQYGNGRLSSKLDVPKYLTQHGIEYHTKSITDGIAYLLQCPFDPNHGVNGESSLIQSDSGLLTFHCMHDSCSGRRWADFKEVIGSPQQEHWAAHAADQADGQPPPPEPPRFCNMLTCAEFADLDLKPTYLVNKILVENQPAVVGGRSKTLKTSLLVDLAVSLGSGTPFLGHFDAQPRSVGIWSGESGAPTLQETGKRVCRARKIDLRDCQIQWSFNLPKLCRPDHIRWLADTISKRAIDVAIIDPLYLSLLDADTAGSAGNLFAMGAALQPLSDLAQDAGITVIVAHHFRKTGTKDIDEPAPLEELAQSGIVEWARQWLLLERRTPYAANGFHELWLRAGGSAGHAGLYALDVDEGELQDDFTGRRWDVSIRRTSDVREALKDQKRHQQAEEQAQRAEDDCRRLLEACRRFPEGETLRQLREVSGLNSSRAADAIRTLLGECRVETIQIRKHTRNETGYKPTGK